MFKYPQNPYHLQRFVAAQDAAGTYDHAVAELRAGRKTSHLDHPVLGARLAECATILTGLADRTEGFIR
jgi:uncharacterized protein (DUF1810 family)